MTSMPRLTPIVALIALLAGCEYAPLAVDENRPGLEDSIVDPEVVVYGTGVMEYSARNDDGVDCVIEHDIIGWKGAPSAARDCTTCSDTYTLFREANDDTTCDDLVAQSHAIGWDIIDNVREDPWAGNGTSSEEWLDEPEQSDVIGALRTTWTVFGYTDDPTWEARFVLREVAEDDWPAAPDDVEFTRAYTARDRWRWAVSRAQSISWRMDLQFTD